jgi:hypothetical protein
MMPNQNDSLTVPAGFNPQSHTLISPGIATQSQLITQPTQIGAVSQNPTHASDGGLILQQNNPPAPRITSLVGNSCGCGCDCECGDIAVMQPVQTQQPHAIVTTANPTHAVQNTLQPNNQQTGPISYPIPKPCGCAGASSRVYRKNDCRCGCKPRCCNKTKLARPVKPRIVNSSQLATQLSGGPITIKPYSQFTSDGNKTIRIQTIGIVPVLEPQSGINTCSTAQTTAPGQDYYPIFNNFLGGGEVLENVNVVTIFWGDYWTTSEGESIASYINSFFDTIVTSTLMDFLQEYNAGGPGSHDDIIYVIGNGANIGVVPSFAIRNMVTSLFPDQVAWEPNMVYMVYMSPGVDVLRDDGTLASKDGFAGYHEQSGGGPSGAFPFTIGVICPWTNGSTSYDRIGVDLLTRYSSHELCEAITRPNIGWPYSGWLGDYSGPEKQKLGSPIEIGDECYQSIAQIGEYSIQGIWSRRQAACAIAPWPWADFQIPVQNSPAIATDGKSLVMACTLLSPPNPFGVKISTPIQIMNNSLNGGLSFTGTITLQDKSNPYPEASIDRPALVLGSGGRMFIAWTGTDKPNHHINLMSSGDPRFEIWGDKIVIDEWSNSAPALAYAPPTSIYVNGILFLAFTGTNNNIYLRWSTDGTWPDSNKKELQQWSPDGPCIFYSDPYLYLSFRSTINDWIYVCRTSDFGQTLDSLQTIPNQATDNTPALTSTDSNLFIAWRGTDPNHRINAMSADISDSTKPLGTFTNQVIYGDQASGALSMTTYPFDSQPSPYIAWAGTDPDQSLNVMPLPPYLQSCYS